jgi:TatD DNase family protein
MIAICCRLTDFEAVSKIAEAHDDVYCTIGAHPHHAKDRPDITADELLEIARHPKVVAIGETGLDFHYNHSPEDEQYQSLRAHIDAARRADLPLILHCREADEKMADLLEEEMGKGAFRPLLHCYTGGPGLARRAAALGAYFSASGIITFKKAEDVREVFRDVVPDDRVIVETDCPYLAPVPYRGRRNEPAYLPHVAEKLGEIKGWTAEETATRTTAAALALFDRIKVKA